MVGWGYPIDGHQRPMVMIGLVSAAKFGDDFDREF